MIAASLLSRRKRSSVQPSGSNVIGRGSDAAA
jgi:hypothetical protein